MFVSINSKHLSNETRRFPDKIFVTFTIRGYLSHLVSRCIPGCLKTSHTLGPLVFTAQPRCVQSVLHIPPWVGETLPTLKKESVALYSLWLGLAAVGWAPCWNFQGLPWNSTDESHNGPLAQESCGKSSKLLSSGVEHITLYFLSCFKETRSNGNGRRLSLSFFRLLSFVSKHRGVFHFITQNMSSLQLDWHEPKFNHFTVSPD